MTPYSLQKHLPAEYTMCTEPTLSMQNGTCCPPRQGNQKQWPQQVMRSVFEHAVLILLVSHFQRMQCQHLWMKSGTSKKRRYIPIDAVLNKLPNGSASSLLAFHALTGCDTTSYIANRTKRSSWKIFKEHHGLLKNLGIGELIDDTIQSSETFACRIYNVHRTDSIDAEWHLLSSTTGKPEAMAPTSDALRFHLKRVHYQSMIWRNAHCATPELPAPSEMGWRLMDSELQPVLMTLSPIPDTGRQLPRDGRMFMS